ncbi:hypothetical protein [Achromobacter aloeverae]|uniref:Uncharacterized protein n=1 Tax=Achromobacter aloeverae TaxID=1750518 RepID=A0A4V1MRX8_9BURK|nr:hypothetical protein [Achromobacter aloeverae]RXN86868.1 hypothetical protein C7R54_18345 [Achromobacter aloeverae]
MSAPLASVATQQWDRCGRPYTESTDEHYHGRDCWPPGPKILPASTYVSTVDDSSIVALANRVYLGENDDTSPFKIAKAMCGVEANQGHCDTLNIFTTMKPGLVFEVPTRDAIAGTTGVERWYREKFRQLANGQRWNRGSMAKDAALRLTHGEAGCPPL